MNFLPGFTQLAYFDKTIEDYHIIGELTHVWNTLFPDNKDKKTEVCLFLVKCYAGKDKYFRDREIPLTPKEFKKFSPKAGLIVFKDTPTTLKNQNKYIKISAKKNKQSFLFYLRAGLSSVTKTEHGYKYKPINLYPALLPLIHKKIERTEKDNKFSNYFRNIIWQEVVKENNEIIISHKKYWNTLINVASIIADYHDKEELLVEDRTRLNNIEFTPSDPITEFIYSFLYELKEHLRNKKIVGFCPICRKVFLYKYNKIYCSHRCAKKRQNKDYYSKYWPIILPKKVKEMQELRKLYRKKGIKK